MLLFCLFGLHEWHVIAAYENRIVEKCSSCRTTKTRFFGK